MNPFAYFLLDGCLHLQPDEGAGRELAAGDLDAGFPIAHLRPSHYRVTAQANSRLIRIEASKLKRPVGKPRAARFLITDDVVGGSWQSHPLVVDLMARLREGKLAIPAIPGIALKIRRALAKDDFSVERVATVITADPAIAAQLIKISNSVVFGSLAKCESVQAALVRLGMERIQNIVFTLSTKGLFSSKQTFIKELMLQRWRHAIEIASLAAVLGKLTPGLDGDQGLLVGLLHEIGAVPILQLAEAYPDLAQTPGVLDEILAGLVPLVSARVLEQWDFPEIFSHAAREQSNWFREHAGEHDYADVIIVAHLHSLVQQREFHKLPRLDETPAFEKLAVGLLSPQLSLLVLDEAQAQIRELKSLLS
jgi:HD-like signal output (HDOD) protein